MLKTILSLILCLALLQVAKAGTADTVTVYLKNSGQKVAIKDSADFYRVILPPDTNMDKDLYRVYDYYFNGKPKSVATSFTQPIDLVLEGTRMEYFPSGKRKRTSQYKNGRLIGSMTSYYPNGRLYNTLKIEDLNYYYNNRYYSDLNYSSLNYNYKIEVVELRDSLGNVLVQNGNGHVIDFDDTFKKIRIEGDIKNNKREGEWRGLIADSGKFICTFHKDVLKSGESYTKAGHHYAFKQVYTQAAFSDGKDAFYLYIKKNLQYPESAKKRKLTGRVPVEFCIETNGTVSEVKVNRGQLKSLDDEAIRVISMSPLWIPASRFGIPYRSYYNVTVDFTNF